MASMNSKWNRQDMDKIIRVLQVFFLALGLKINVSKSNVFRIGASFHDIEDMARDTGCGSGSVPFYYLGLPIEAYMHLTANWQPLIDRWAGNWEFKAIHGGEAGLDLKVCNCNGVWSSIISSYAMLHERNILPINTLCRKVGNDLNVDCLLSDRRFNNAWVWNWKRQVMGSRNEAALALLVSELGQVQFSDRPDS
ncbi:hypothetical protein Tco_0732977, partial [Tanacetum coccineum]